jgi:hypothetical protein
MTTYSSNLYYDKYNKLDSPILSHYYYFGMFLVAMGRFIQVVSVIFCIIIIVRVLSG